MSFGLPSAALRRGNDNGADRPYIPEGPGSASGLTAAARHRMIIDEEGHVGVARQHGEGDWARTLDAITQCAERLPVTRKQDLEPGDCVIVSTRNSVYRLQALGGNLFHASGGWFEKNPVQRTVTINGCTFGGPAICTDIVAANGLFLEFGNNVTTTRIQDVRVLRLGREPAPVLH